MKNEFLPKRRIKKPPSFFLKSDLKMATNKMKKQYWYEKLTDPIKKFLSKVA